MIKNVTLKYAAAVMMALSVIACFIPLINMIGIKVSIVDFIVTSSELTAFLDEYADYLGFLQEKLNAYRTGCWLIIIMPIIGAVAVVVLKGVKALIAAALSIVVNNTIAWILYDSVKGILEYVNSAFGIFTRNLTFDMLGTPVIVWILCYVVVAAIVVYSAFAEYETLKKEAVEKESLMGISEIIMEKFHLKKEKIKTQESHEKSTNIIDDTAVEFAGGIIAERGEFRGKIFLFRKNEKISLGSEQTDDVFAAGTAQLGTYCLISYDFEMEEYHVRPLIKNGVKLANGQPLGKDRVYCIPRGKVLIIDNKKNMFKLA